MRQIVPKIWMLALRSKLINSYTLLSLTFTTAPLLWHKLKFKTFSVNTTQQIMVKSPQHKYTYFLLLL